MEALVAAALVALLAGAAAPSFRDIGARLTLRHATTQLVVSLEAARAMALAQSATVRLAPRPGATGFSHGWQLVARGRGAGRERDGGVLLSVALDSPCLSITLHGTDATDVLRITGMGYSRSARGGFYAGRFRLRCGPLERQVRLGPLGQVRTCTPGIEPDCGTGDAAGLGDDGSDDGSGGGRGSSNSPPPAP